MNMHEYSFKEKVQIAVFFLTLIAAILIVVPCLIIKSAFVKLYAGDKNENRIQIQK